MAIKIEPWITPAEQRIYNGKKAWTIGNLIAKAKDLPVKEMPLEHLNIKDLSLSFETLRDVVMNIRAVLNADLSYPIILDENGSVMDGRHRIAKALLEEKETIKFVRFEKDPTPDYCLEDDEK